MESGDSGEFEVFQEPRKGHQYRVGVDVSEGLDIGRDTDWSVAVVLNAQTYEQVAMLRTMIDPDLLAWKLKTIGKWYNDALVLVERNNHGLVTLKYMLDVHTYSNLYSEKILDERSNRTARKLGFHTTVKSKPLILDYLRELIREDEIILHSTKLIDELQTFVNLSSGKMQAQSGSHDDCVMSLAIAAFGCRIMPYYGEPSHPVTPGGPAFRRFRPTAI